MNFSQALDLLKQGKKVKRSFWGGYWELASYKLLLDSQESSVMIFAHLKDNGGLAPAQPYQADLLADDWEVVK